MKIPSPKALKKGRIEIVPLIDIMFFLLATFVMVSMSMVKNKGIPVNLPVASTTEATSRNDYASITVTEDGSYFFNKQKLSLVDIREEINRVKSSTPDPKIFINGDQKADFGAAIAVLDEVRRAGIVKVAIETKQSENVKSQ